MPIEKLRGIGIAIPGIYDATMNKILTAPLLGIQEEYDISMQLDFMQKRYPVPIIVENDTNAQCFGEYCAQNLSNKDDLVFISLGTGIGAGLIIQGKLRHGIHNMCGEIGYMAFMDDYVSGYEQPGWLESKIGYRALKEEFGFSLEEDNLNLNKKETALMIDYITPFITLCINNIVMLLDTANIVLGGIIVNRLGDQLIENVNLKVKELCINKVTIKKQTCSDIGLMGLSAVLANQTILNILEED